MREPYAKGSVSVIGVNKFTTKRMLDDSRGLFKPDAVLFKVRFVFAIIPFGIHNMFDLNTMYLQLQYISYLHLPRNHP